MPARLTGLASTELMLTDKRLIGRVGMFRRRRLSLPHRAIEIVKSQRGLIGALCNYGALTIIGRDGTRIRFRGIANPLDMELQCNEAIEVAILGHSLSKTVMEMPAGIAPRPVVTKGGPRLESRLPVIEQMPAAKPAPKPLSAEPAMAVKARKDPNAW